MTTFFVTGIGTDVGKTLVSAILVEALKADYFKPIQAGDLNHGDAHRIKALVTNNTSIFHPNSYALNTAMSPHAAAAIDQIQIDLSKIKRPNTKNNLVIEGAGGLLVPLNDTQTICDLMQPNDNIVVVSRHYLGSINHSLLTLNYLKERGFKPFLVFNGKPHPSTEDIILKMTDVSLIGHLEEEPYFDKNVVKDYAERWKDSLKKLL